MKFIRILLLIAAIPVGLAAAFAGFLIVMFGGMALLFALSDSCGSYGACGAEKGIGLTVVGGLCLCALSSACFGWFGYEVSRRRKTPGN
jgi:hypothetical protein